MALRAWAGPSEVFLFFFPFFFFVFFFSCLHDSRLDELPVVGDGKKERKERKGEEGGRRGRRGRARWVGGMGRALQAFSLDCDCGGLSNSILSELHGTFFLGCNYYTVGMYRGLCMCGVRACPAPTATCLK